MTRVMGEAFEAACRQITKNQNPLLREVLAKNILAQAQRGERDPDKMCRAALSSMGVDARAPRNEAAKSQTS